MTKDYAKFNNIIIINVIFIKDCVQLYFSMLMSSLLLFLYGKYLAFVKIKVWFPISFRKKSFIFVQYLFDGYFYLISHY